MRSNLISSRCFAVLGIAALSLIAARAADDAPKRKEVTLRALVCESDKFAILMNEDFDERLCTKPLEGIPLFMQSEVSENRTQTVETDSAGRALVGPLRLSGKESFRAVMACETHNCMQLKGLYIGDGMIKAGENRLLVLTVPLKVEEPAPKSVPPNKALQPTSGPGSDAHRRSAGPAGS